LLSVSGAPSSEFSTLSLHDALPIGHRWRIERENLGSGSRLLPFVKALARLLAGPSALDQRLDDRRRVEALIPGHLREHVDARDRSEEHTSELQSRGHLVCRLLPEKT